MSKNNNNPVKDDKSILMDMPEVKDIPGQENVIPPRMREMEDSTPSSSDEEGEGILDDLNAEDSDEILGNDDATLEDDDTNVTAEEKDLLDQTDLRFDDEVEDLKKVKLDSTDGEDVLNEEGDPLDFGGDLDVPGSEDDDSDEELGEEDEENNAYSNPN